LKEGLKEEYGKENKVEGRAREGKESLKEEHGKERKV